MFKRNVSLSINSDGRTISDINLNEEYHKLSNLFGWSVEHLKKCNLNAIDHAFTSDENKAILKKKNKSSLLSPIVQWIEQKFPKL